VWLVPLLLLAVTLPTHANPRFRAPLDPVLVVFASATVARVSAGRRYAGRLRIRQRRTAQSEPVTSR
jgi:hypothetical protein